MNKNTDFSTDFSTDFISLTYLGELVRGSVLDKTKPQGKINVPSYLKVSTKCFVLKMNGDSMQSSGLLHNDLLVIEPSSTAQNNSVVVATIDNLETVVKYFEQTNDLIILSSKNPDVKPMIFDPSRIRISGVLVSQMRSY